MVNNIAFEQIDSLAFREMMIYANDFLEEAGCLPTRKTIREWILNDWRGYKGIVTELLNSAQGQVHIAMDMWTSCNLLSLCRLVVHFIDGDGNLRNFLLSIPELIGRHTGSNIYEGATAIINEFNIQDRIGYFVLDNASNNDTCMQALAEEFEFDKDERRLCCVGHIINLVTCSILFGKDPDALEKKFEKAKEEVRELELWRKKGLIRKLHNIVKYIKESG